MNKINNNRRTEQRYEQRKDKRQRMFISLIVTGVSCLFTLPSISYSETIKYQNDMLSDGMQTIDAGLISQQLDDSPIDFSKLTTYNELVEKLYKIEKRSNGAVNVGPLIKNVNEDGVSNNGLIDIDSTLVSDISLRQSVINTVLNDNEPNLGNLYPENIGKSNKGRDIMAATFGHGPKKVVYITQQHGNEFIETEAAFGFLKKLGKLNQWQTQKIQEEITLLMIVRANPDGGEPDPGRCQMGTPFPPSATPYDCAFYRFNIDPTAGTKPTDDNFRGAVGVGYNLNRYHTATLDRPIRPVESQAMVSAILAFQPNFILDMHGDIPKITCNIDQESIVPVVPGLLYDSNCESRMGSRISSISVRDMAEFIGNSDYAAQTWNSEITKGLRFFGVGVGRHRQFNESVEILNTAGDYSQLIIDGEPVHTMLLEMKNLAPDADLFISGMDFTQSPPAPKIDFALNGVLGKRNLFVGKIISQIIMMNGLTTIANQKIDNVTDDGGYLAIPEDSGFIYRFTDLTLNTLGLTNPGPYLFPLCTFESCLTGN